MAKFRQSAVWSKTSVQAFTAKNRISSPRRQLEERVLSQVGTQVTLMARLVLEITRSNGLTFTRLSSFQQSEFEYQEGSLTWTNRSRLEWHPTIHCLVKGVQMYHPLHPDTPLFEVTLANMMQVDDGNIVSFEPGSLSATGEVLSLFRFPREDYLIEEEPDMIDWQKELVKAARSRRPRKKRS